MTDHPKSVWLSEPLHRRLKIVGAARGQTITELVEAAVRLWLRAQENDPPTTKNGPEGDVQSHP